MISKQPSITTGLRGLSYVEVEVTGPNRDFTWIVRWCRCKSNQCIGKMIASLHDENNHITIPGFMTM
jgi:hypothetical protein